MMSYAFVTRSAALFLALSHTKKTSSSVVDKEFKRNLLQGTSVLLINAKETKTELCGKRTVFLNPISDIDQREIVDRKILKILVRCFLPTSRLMMAGTAEY